jgi:hypothetical protein
MASKKLKKLLKKALPLAALAGGAMMLNRGRNARASTNADAIKAMTSNAAYSGSENMPQGIEKAMVDVPVNLGRMTGSGPNSGSVGQNIRANYAQKMRNAVTGVDGSPGILNPVNNRIMVGRGSFKTGGTVVKSGDKAKKTKKKVGIQIKGFGKARKR